MDPSCFSSVQRRSCQMMNPDLFKPSPERSPPAPTPKPSRNKCEQPKVELAQVVIDPKTGRSYTRGKLLGKVLSSD